MTSEEKALARIIFQKTVLSSDGQAFENLFVAVMQKAKPKFIPIKPQGQIGDRKNDGYDPDDGHYYQVYAPEDITKSTSAAVSKLKEDFTGLKKYWEPIHPVKAFSFVINDKYKGSHPTIESDLAAIKTDHGLKECNSFLAKHLEDTLFSLKDDMIFSIVGFVPNPDKIQNLDFSLIDQIIGHILASGSSFVYDQLLVAPEFEEKINFNGLSDGVATLLKTGSYLVGSLNEYFELNSEFAKQEVRNYLNGLYKEIRDKTAKIAGPAINIADIVFFEILNAIAPNNSQAQSAALVVMAYFFESCDIFDEPTGKLR